MTSGFFHCKDDFRTLQGNPESALLYNSLYCPLVGSFRNLVFHWWMSCCSLHPPNYCASAEQVTSGNFPIFITNHMKRKQFTVIVFHGDVDFLPFHLQTMSKTAKRLEPFSWNFKALYNVSAGWLPLQLSPWYFGFFLSNMLRGLKYQFQLSSGWDLTNSFTNRF